MLPREVSSLVRSVGAERQTRIQALSVLELLAGFAALVLVIAVIVLAAWIL